MQATMTKKKRRKALGVPPQPDALRQVALAWAALLKQARACRKAAEAFAGSVASCPAARLAQLVGGGSEPFVRQEADGLAWLAANFAEMVEMSGDMPPFIGHLAGEPVKAVGGFSAEQAHAFWDREIREAFERLGLGDVPAPMEGGAR